MKESQSHTNDERVGHVDEQCSDYWDVTDASSIIESGKKVQYEVVRPLSPCESCGGIKVRKRMVDLPLLDGAVLLRKTRVVYCPNCKRSVIEQSSLQELSERIGLLSKLVNTNSLTDFLEKALISYDHKYRAKTKQRKIFSIYFPTKNKAPAKAQISAALTDPLYPALRQLTSENIRDILGLEFFEDLEKEAKHKNRSISQYLKVELAKKVLDVPVKQEVIPSDRSVIEIVSRKVPDDYFKKDYCSPELKLAAESAEAREIVLLESLEKNFSGIIEYDYTTANLFISVKKNATGFTMFDILLFTHDNETIKVGRSKIDNGRLLLIEETNQKPENIYKVILNFVE